MTPARTDDEKRVLCAEACGYCEISKNAAGYYIGRKIGEPVGWHAIPDYLTDLNAAHELEKTLTPKERHNYAYALIQPTGDTSGGWDCAHATARQRVDAFLKTKGLAE